MGSHDGAGAVRRVRMTARNTNSERIATTDSAPNAVEYVDAPDVHCIADGGGVMHDGHVFLHYDASTASMSIVPSTTWCMMWRLTVAIAS